MIRSWRDVLLALLGAQFLALGSWAVLGPRDFYDSFPGGGRHWIDVDGPFNEHLIRDVGALWLGLGVVVVLALRSRVPAVVRAAGLATAVYSVPHLLYHLFNLDPYGTSDAIASVGGLALTGLAGAALALSPAPDPPAAARDLPAGGQTAGHAHP